MKQFFNTIILLLALLIMQSCNKSIEERNVEFASLDPVKTDANAGLWKPILLTSATEFAVAAPAATTTPAYIADINEIKGWQRRLTETHQYCCTTSIWRGAYL